MSNTEWDSTPQNVEQGLSVNEADELFQDLFALAELASLKDEQDQYILEDDQIDRLFGKLRQEAELLDGSESAAALSECFQALETGVPLPDSTFYVEPLETASA